jgi:short-subunit dehydrogenase
MPRPAALITGPTSGIGAGYARRYLKGEAGSIETLPADLADPAECNKVAERLAARVRVLVNNAGLGTSGEAIGTAGRMIPRNLMGALTKRVGGGRGRT